MPVFVNWLTWPGALHLPLPCWNCLLILTMMCSIALSSVLNFSFHQWQVGKHSSVFVMEVLASAPYLPMLQLPTSHRPVFLSHHRIHPFTDCYCNVYNQQVTEGEDLTMVSVLLSPPRQHLLSEKVEKLALSSLLHNATTATKARLLAESVPQAHAWLRTVPSPGLGLALEPDETHILLKWWLGLPLCNLEETCPYCSSQLESLGHHSLTCRYAGDVVTDTTAYVIVLLTFAVVPTFPLFWSKVVVLVQPKTDHAQLTF